MINRNAKAKQHRRGACVGPLACHVNGFAAFLLREGYAAKTVKEKYGLTIDLSRGWRAASCRWRVSMRRN
jgi:hypothetical protein